jgi:Flp pilus assembly pilin Flp
MNLIKRAPSTALVRDTEGLSTVEYIMILCLIVAVCLGVWGNFGEAVQGKIDARTQDISGLPDSDSQ